MKLCVFTGSRAEYGLLKPLMAAIKNDDETTLQIIVSGMHLSPEFGLTSEIIEKDGFKAAEKVEILLSSDSPIGISKSMGLGLISFSETLQRLEPDILIILGDRFEALSAAIAAMILNIPIAHIHGGEATYGAIDESIRHAITKISHLHFPSTEKYRQRIIQLGENPKNVLNVGALGVENIQQLPLLTLKELEDQIKFKFKKTTILCTFHPITINGDQCKNEMQSLLNAISKFPDIQIIFTYANADAQGHAINTMINDFVDRNWDRSIVFKSMGQLNYLSTMKFISAIVGNSSSAIIEAPSFKLPSVNIGDRQSGRIKGLNVIDCGTCKRDIIKAMRIALSDDFKRELKNMPNPYFKKNTSSRILKKIKSTNLKSTLKKKFYDIIV